LHQELVKQPETLSNGNPETNRKPADLINVSVFGMRDEFTELDLRAWHPVPVYPFSVRGPRSFGYAPGLSSRLMALHPDLVHVHGLWQYNSVATLAWHRKSRRPFIVSPHGMLDPWAFHHSRWKKCLGWLAYERSHLGAATCIRALCQSEANSIRALGVSNPICVIPNGVDLPPAGGDPVVTPRAELALLRNRKVLLYLGRIHPKKGLANLLKAWATVENAGDWVLVILGWDQSGHLAELKQLAGELKIPYADAPGKLVPGASVMFLGPQFGPAKREWLRRCDAFILPSFSEGVPMAVLEAWAHANPVLITAQCNLPQGFTTGAAIAIEPEPEAIASGLREVFRTKGLVLESIGLRGRELVLRDFAWPRIVAELRAVYLWVAGGGQKPECVLSR
jgi:poly(glycerol-phosphate) alpha-glucosyltransferase